MTAARSRRAFLAQAAAGGLALAAGALPADAAGARRRRLYVAINGSMTIYDAPALTVRRTIALPTSDGVRGIACHPGIGSLWITHGSPNGHGGSVLRYDLIRHRVAWNRVLGLGVDQPAVTLSGRRLFVPS